MQDYTLQKVDSKKYEWVRVDSWDNLTINKQEAKAYSKDISSYCGRLLEETEDELAERIKKGSVKSRRCEQDFMPGFEQALYHVK
ncbi:hypothetical protein OIU78_021493 [Salix suchowensis]|nr:hypothetical protein OIU78_021493 [Salix suchowensis]